MNFQHFLITRINVDWNISRPRSQAERNDIEFLTYRFNVFEQVCYPSIQSQTNKNFIWLLLIDAETPEIFRERIASYQSDIKILPIDIENKETLLKTTEEAISRHISKPVTHLITTNFDSDDAASKNFITAIQQEFQGQDFEFINFPLGYLYQIKQQQLFLRNWSTAPCHTLIERYSSFCTAIQYPHVDITNYQNKQVITDPIWLMTAHDMNVRTRFDISAAWQPLNRLSRDFQTHLGFPKKTSIQTYKEIYSELLNVIFSKREWDHPRVKLRKTLTILSPSMMHFFIKLLYRFRPTSKTRHK